LSSNSIDSAWLRPRSSTSPSIAFLLLLFEPLGRLSGEPFDKPEKTEESSDVTVFNTGADWHSLMVIGEGGTLYSHWAERGVEGGAMAIFPFILLVLQVAMVNYIGCGGKSCTQFSG
jgi:hypothetical protein